MTQIQQVLIYFLLLLAIMLGGYWFKRYGIGLLQGRPRAARKLEVEEMRMLGNRQFLVVARYEQTKVMLGVSPGRIEYLCRLENDSDGDCDRNPEKDAERDPQSESDFHPSGGARNKDFSSLLP